MLFHTQMYLLLLRYSTKRRSSDALLCMLFFISIAVAQFEAAKAQNVQQFLKITDAEIRRFVNELQEVSPRLAVPVNFQGHTRRNSRDDASEPLFRDFNQSEVTQVSEMVPRLLKLYDNYEPRTGQPEIETAEEQAEVRNFLDTLLKTRPVQKLYILMRQKGHPFATNPIVFRRSLEQIWFGHYSRARGKPDTSGFEHVFIGELKNNEVSGLHNWIRFLYLEKKADVAHDFDYKGFLVKRKKVFGAIKFSWLDTLKSAGSFLIGTAPEFDFALYTLCFLARRDRGEKCNFEMDGCKLSVTSYDLVQGGRLYIGSMYPAAGPVTDGCS